MSKHKIKDYLNFFKAFEKQYNVYSWKYEDIDIWPIIKSNVYLSLFGSNKTINKNKSFLAFNLLKKIKAKAIIEYRKNVKFIRGYFSKKQLKNIDVLFVAPIDSRANYNGKTLSRLVDPIMDELEKINKSSIFIEFSSEFSNTTTLKYKEERIIDWHSFKHYKKSTKIDTSKFSHLNEIQTLSKHLNTTFNYNEQLFWAIVYKNLSYIISYIPICNKILDKTQPKSVMNVCYYSQVPMTFIYCCNKRNINVLDINHGGVGFENSSYNFENLDKKLNTLPNMFWTWCKEDTQFMTMYLDKKYYTILTGGNPWIHFLKDTEKKSPLTKDTNKTYILYTLQTQLKTIISPIISAAILEAKSQKLPFIWIFRLHPRMSKIETTEVNNFIIKNNIEDYVKIDNGNYNLIEMLLFADIHVSMYSGSIVEAALVGVKANIILDEIGRNNYKLLIKNKKAIYYNNKTHGALNQFINKIDTNKINVSASNIKNTLKHIY